MRKCGRTSAFINSRQRGPTAGPRGVCGPPQHFQWSAEALWNNLQIWNLLTSVWSYCTFGSLKCLSWIKCICPRAMTNTFSVCHFLYLCYHHIRRYRHPLTLRWGTYWITSVFFSVPEWVHLAQWTQYRQMIPSICQSAKRGLRKVAPS